MSIIRDRIQLDEEDIRTGLLYEMQAARAQGRLDAILEMATGFAAEMRIKYGASAAYVLNDWLIGFERTIDPAQANGENATQAGVASENGEVT